MEIESAQRIRTISFTVMVVVLLLIAAGCTGTLVMSSRAADGLDSHHPMRNVLVRIAVLSTASLGLSLVLVGWAAMRFLSDRLRPHKPRQETEYVDVWSVAGQRLQVEDEDDEEEEDDDLPL